MDDCMYFTAGVMTGDYGTVWNWLCHRIQETFILTNDILLNA